MYNHQSIRRLIEVIHSNDGCNNKEFLENVVQAELNLTLKRSVYTCQSFSIRFSKAESINFANVVISLSTLKKYDSTPFFVCVITPTKNYLLLANTYMIDKASHSSQNLSLTRIRGSILGSNILKEREGLTNVESNFERLFELHSKGGFFQGNIARIVENTEKIVGTKKAIFLSESDKQKILNSVDRSKDFIESNDHMVVLNELKDRVNTRKEYIKLASKYDNVNLRGRLIEYIITGDESDSKWREVINALIKHQTVPHFTTKDDLGDFSKTTRSFRIKADIKSEMMELSSNPKGYNVDKMLSFLSDDRSVFCLFFVGIDTNTSEYKIKVALCSMFDDVLLSSTRIQHHWSGRGTRGVAQFEGEGIKKILNNGPTTIELKKARAFLEQLINKKPDQDN